MTAETTVSECARPRAQQAPNVLTRRISLYLCRFPTLLRPRTGALRHDLLPLSLTHYSFLPKSRRQTCGRVKGHDSCPKIEIGGKLAPPPLSPPPACLLGTGRFQSTSVLQSKIDGFGVLP